MTLDSTQTTGFVCAHHHLYSTLARGMPAPSRQSGHFTEILEDIWWRLDAALDEQMLYWSAALGAVEALLVGTTAIVDHHESPHFIDGSLSVLAKACRDVGVRLNTSYGVTDRWDDSGNLHSSVDPRSPMTAAARRGLDECDRYLSSGGEGMVGLHAAFTCSDETIAAAAQLAQKHGVGVHVHVAEGPVDKEAGNRLAPFAKDDWLLVHGVYLDTPLRGRLVHNPRSNMNNAVGYARPTTRENTVLLGTDGIGSDMLDEARVAYARLREFDVQASPETVWGWLKNNQVLMPATSRDVVTWNYDHMDSPWHLAFTTGVRPIKIQVNDDVVLDEGLPTKIDIHEVRAKAAEQSRRLHERLNT
jgi:cytosine/adenosine deaminase-related metal-dependent hydrolase